MGTTRMGPAECGGVVGITGKLTPSAICGEGGGGTLKSTLASHSGSLDMTAMTFCAWTDASDAVAVAVVYSKSSEEGGFIGGGGG